MAKSFFEFTDKFGYDSPWEEEQITPQNSVPPKISIKCSTLNLKIKINCVADINFILGGSSGWGNGFDHYLKLSSDDTNLKIYDDTFEVDNGWAFIASISNSEVGRSNLLISTKNNLTTTFSFDFVDENSVFTRVDKDTITTENSALVGNDKVCFRVADKELAKLLNDNGLILESYEGLSGFTRMDDYDKKGYIYKSKKFEQSTIWKRHTDGNYKLKPYEFAGGQSNCFSDFINLTMLCMGIHVYHFILLNGYHVLILLVDNTNNCKPKFKILDQLKFREWEDLNQLNDVLLKMTINNYNGACDASTRKDINSSINLCKITAQ